MSDNYGLLHHLVAGPVLACRFSVMGPPSCGICLPVDDCRTVFLMLAESGESVSESRRGAGARVQRVPRYWLDLRPIHSFPIHSF